MPASSIRRPRRDARATSSSPMADSCPDSPLNKRNRRRRSMPTASSPAWIGGHPCAFSRTGPDAQGTPSRPGRGAAAAGGFTTWSACRTPPRSPTLSGRSKYIHNAIEHGAVVRRLLRPACITVGQKGEHLAPTGSLKRAGVVAITDDGRCVQNNEIIAPGRRVRQDVRPSDHGPLARTRP